MGTWFVTEGGCKYICKDMGWKYLKMVKPLYVRVSRRSEKVDVSSPESAEASTVAEKIPTVAEDSESANLKGPKQGNVALPAALRKHLGKGRSAAVAAPAPPSVSSKRRDDSLLQQHDWIQGAILHCKNSFNASTGNLLLLHYSVFPFVGTIYYYCWKILKLHSKN